MTNREKKLSIEELKDEFNLFKRFLSESKKDQFSSLYKTNNGRKRFLKKFSHDLIFDEKYRHEATENDHFSWKIFELLKKMNAPSTCYVLSEAGREEMLLKDAVELIGSLHSGFLISCIPNKLLYLENESGTCSRYLIY